MNNETQRKITSLTLMTIMLAGGMTFAIPGVMPEAMAAQPNISVSAEKFGGPMVLQITVNDQSVKDTDEVKGQPNVIFDDNKLVMSQGDDGLWYAFVADKSMAIYATENTSINFGDQCADVAEADALLENASFDDSVTVFTSSDDCSELSNPNAVDTVVSDPRDLNGNNLANPSDTSFGQVGLAHQNHWPFIQTFDFTDDDNMKLTYDGSTFQEYIITYEDDMDENASHSTDRSNYPHGADIHLVIDDMQLNIDPTAEDIWTFNVDTGDSYYEGNISAITPEDQNNLSYLDNGFLSINAKNVIIFDDNLLAPTGLKIADGPFVTVEESSLNSGLFENTDTSNNANMITTDDESVRDNSGIIEYNSEFVDPLVGFFTGVIDMDKTSIDDEWSSGELITVTINDQDENTNTRSSDDFDVSNGEIEAIPSIQLGNPITLASFTGVTVSGTADTTVLDAELDELNDELIILNLDITNNQTAVDTITSANNIDGLLSDLDDAINDLEAASDALSNAYTGGASQSVIDSLTLAEDIAQVDVTGNQTAVTAAYAGLQPDDIDQINELEVLLLQQTNLENSIASLEDAINSSSGQIPLTNSEARPFSKMLNIDSSNVNADPNPEFTISTTIDSSVLNDLDLDGVYRYINYDFRSLNADTVTLSGATSGSYALTNQNQGLQSIDDRIPNDFEGALTITIAVPTSTTDNENSFNVIFDVFTFGQDEDGNRYNDAIYRYEAEETEDNTGIYSGTVEYIMLNQINIFEDTTFSGLETIGNELEIIVHEDLTDEDSVEIIYYDVNKQGISKQISDQTDAPTQSATVSFDSGNYKVADTVTVTLDDSDLNTDSTLVDIYTVVSDSNTISHPDFPDRSRLLDVTFDDNLWEDICQDAGGLYGSMSSLIETEKDSGLFTATFQVPARYCDTADSSESVTGLDIEVNYVDFRDASGEEIEVGDSAGIRANTGSISLDRTVYPVPFGVPSDFPDTTTSPAIFSVHNTALGDNPKSTDGTYLVNGDLTIHVRVNDPDFDISASGEDTIAEESTHGPIKVMISRGSSTVVLGTAGAEIADDSGLITLTEDIETGVTREYGPITEIAPDSGIFELDMIVSYTDGPSSSTCPTSTTDSLSHIDVNSEDDNNQRHCILQGDILTVQYTDPTDASGDPNTVTDSATFDLRNGVLQSDKSVYLIGSDMIMTLIEPDLDLDNDQAETYDLDLIEWDSDAATTTMGNLGGGSVFDPEPTNFRETGDSTGIFQVVIEIPEALDGENLDRGEEIELEYTDWGPSGADFVGDEDEDVNLTIFTSNFGATVELDQKVYTWTDKVYITVVAPDHNFDNNLVDEIGNTEKDPLTVSSRGNNLDNYKLVETGTDTGIFTGEVILTGFPHNADGDTTTGNADGSDTNPRTEGFGPTGGFLEADDDDGLTISFEYTEDETVLGSALIRWNIGEVQWLEASYPASGTGVVRVIDPDMNLDPEAVDNYDVDVWSDSDVGGIDLTVTETNEATGIFEGTVFFTTTDQSSGHRLRVAEGDTVTAEYEDNTLPDPYTTADELDITATSLIGTVVPPLERAPAANLRTVDAFGNSLDSVTVDQQVQISADLSNGQDRSQDFAYLVQVQNEDGVTVSLAWITGSLSNGQSFTPALSWIPENSGSYTATAFVWESVDNPTALSPPVSTTVKVS